MSSSKDSRVIRANLSGDLVSRLQKISQYFPYLVGGVAVPGDPICTNDWENGVR